LYSNEKNGLQQIQMESCQPIKRLKDKKTIVHSDSFIQPDDEGRKDFLPRWHISTVLQEVTSQIQSVTVIPRSEPEGP
jgi:hypothetical protein